MRTAALGLLLIANGVALALASAGAFGEILVISGFVVLVYRMVQITDSDASGGQAEIGAQADEVGSSYQRRV